MEHRTIEIDFDVHKRIEAERESFSETPNGVLRRLLGMDRGSASSAAPAPLTDGRPWTGKGVLLPHGTQVRMDYNGQALSGRIEDGRWAIEGQYFTSPSSAASELCRTKSGRKTSLDGWKYWLARRSGDDKWTPISEMRFQQSGAKERVLDAFRK